MSEPKEKYQYITAIEESGELFWEYKIEGNPTEGSVDHDEDVSDWSDDEIIDLTMRILDVDESQRSLITVEHG